LIIVARKAGMSDAEIARVTGQTEQMVAAVLRTR
jgi:predicted transcriptional regulator